MLAIKTYISILINYQCISHNYDGIMELNRKIAPEFIFF